MPRGGVRFEHDSRMYTHRGYDDAEGRACKLTGKPLKGIIGIHTMHDPHLRRVVEEYEGDPFARLHKLVDESGDTPPSDDDIVAAVQPILGIQAKALQLARGEEDTAQQTFDTIMADLVARGRATEADVDAATDRIANGETEAAILREWQPVSLKDGCRVVLKALVSRPDLNGQVGRIVSFTLQSRRYGVQVKSGERIAVRPANVETLPTNVADPAVDVLSEALGADAAGHVSSMLICERCREPCEPGTQCRVPHPVHLRQEQGMMCGPDGMRRNVGCGACRRSFVICTNPMAEDGGEERIEGPEWCFAGAHTTKPLPAHDQRRVFANTVCLVASARLQAQIDAIPADTRTLTISSADFYDESMTFTLERELLELEEVQLIDVCFEKIVLDATLTPSVRSLKMQNVPEDCDLTLQLPELRYWSIHYWRGDGEVIQACLNAATRLEEFDSYKLWSNHELAFASNDLVEIDVHRADVLGALTIWAPNLRHLCLQACYGLDDIEFLSEHPLAAQLPPGHRSPKLEVNTENANIGPRATRALRERGCKLRAAGGRGAMNPLEAMFANMRGPMGGMGGMGGMGADDDDGGDDDGDDDGDDYDDDDEEDEDDDEDDDDDDPSNFVPWNPQGPVDMDFMNRLLAAANAGTFGDLQGDGDIPINFTQPQHDAGPSHIEEVGGDDGGGGESSAADEDDDDGGDGGVSAAQARPGFRKFKRPAKPPTP